MPLLVKIYKILINEIHGLLEEKKDDYDAEYDDEGDDGVDDNADEEVDSDNLDKDEIDIDENGADTINSYLNKYDLFEDAFDKDDLTEVEDDPEALDNPLMKIDLLEFLTNYLKTLSQHPCYTLFNEHHNDLEKEVLKEIGIMV